uniref:Uncharacterized protein n=1 Tax=Panagrolaimus sp. PS1159 TaxID=55785 RepID=A0AC35GE71_9BILA
MVVGSYLITSTNIRIRDENGSRFLSLPNAPSLTNGRLTSATLKQRFELVLKMVPKKMKNLVFVNSGLSTFDLIQACVEVGEKYADNIIVIPPLLALLTYAFEDLSNFRNPPSKEVLLVITVTPKFVDFIISRRNQNSKLCIAHFEHFEDLNQSKTLFPKIYNFWYPHSTIIIFHETMQNFATNIKKVFNPENCFIKPFKKWDFFLLHGGLFRAMDDEDGFDSRYHVANFSSGYETSIQNDKTLIYERHILLPQHSALPCYIYGFNGIGQQINVFYSPEYYQMGDKLICQKRLAIMRYVSASGKAQEVLGYIDERGVPYAKDTMAFKNLKLSKPQKFETQTLAKDVVLKANQIPSTLETRPFPPPSLPILNDPPQINFLFCDNLCAIEVLENRFWKILKDCSGIEWTPLYLSMAHGSVGIGEIAKIHNERFPEYVVYDVLKIIGKPLNEIQIDPKWGFKLVEKDGIIYFQMETISGPRLFPQEMIIAAFLKSMKLQTESILNIQIKEICISTNFKLNESQKTIFEKAAAKNFLGISGFDVL